MDKSTGVKGRGYIIREKGAGGGNSTGM